MLNHLIERLAATRARQASWPAFAQRLQAHGQRLLDELHPLYGERADFAQVAEQLLQGAFGAVGGRQPGEAITFQQALSGYQLEGVVLHHEDA